MTQKTFTELLESMSAHGEGSLKITAPENWMQGRTLYGGLSAALCLEAVMRSNENLPPLRSAQISFIGPAGGEIKITPSLLRKGRSVCFAGADISAETGLATRSVFCFGAARSSLFDRSFIAAPDVPGPEEVDSFFPQGAGPDFAQNFECRLAKGGRPGSGSTEHNHYIWVRYKEAALEGPVALLALADMPPPAMLPMFPKFAPISSMNWMLNILTDNPQTDDGWWLLQSRAENASEGYSSQDMIVWNRAGDAVIAGRQSVAIFI